MNDIQKKVLDTVRKEYGGVLQDMLSDTGMLFNPYDTENNSRIKFTQHIEKKVPPVTPIGVALREVLASQKVQMYPRDFTPLQRRLIEISDTDTLQRLKEFHVFDGEDDEITRACARNAVANRYHASAAAVRQVCEQEPHFTDNAAPYGSQEARTTYVPKARTAEQEVRFDTAFAVANKSANTGSLTPQTNKETGMNKVQTAVLRAITGTPDIQSASGLYVLAQLIEQGVFDPAHDDSRSKEEFATYLSVNSVQPTEGSVLRRIEQAVEASAKPPARELTVTMRLTVRESEHDVHTGFLAETVKANLEEAVTTWKNRPVRIENVADVVVITDKPKPTGEAK